MWGLETRGRETRDLGTSSMGRGISNTGMRGTRDVNDYCDKCDDFGEGNPPYPSYGSSRPVYEADSVKTPCIEESKTTVLVFLLMEYWSPKQGRVGCGRQN